MNPLIDHILRDGKLVALMRLRAPVRRESRGPSTGFLRLGLPHGKARTLWEAVPTVLKIERLQRLS